MNERVRTINNSINMLSMQRDTCKSKLKEKMTEELMEECELFIKNRREARHFKTMSRQKRKLEVLCQKVVLIEMATQTPYIAAEVTAHTKTSTSH